MLVHVSIKEVQVHVLGEYFFLLHPTSLEVIITNPLKREINGYKSTDKNLENVAGTLIPLPLNLLESNSYVNSRKDRFPFKIIHSFYPIRK